MVGILSIASNIGLLGQDFDCTGIPGAQTESALLPLLQRRSPPPMGTPVAFSGKKADAWKDVGMRFLYFGLTQGYGELADYLRRWKASGKPFNTTDAEDLKKYCTIRFGQLFAAYEYAPTPPLGFSLLAQRAFYTLLDQSEKNMISYALGSALTGAVADHYFLQRGDGRLLRLFHRRLVSDAIHSCFPVRIDSGTEKHIPDYIGITRGSHGPVPHVLESKFFEAIKYKGIQKGLRQTRAVKSIGGVRPGSYNLLVSQIRTVKKHQRRVVTSMLRLRPNTLRKQLSSDNGKTLLLLNGLYMLGMSAVVSTVDHGQSINRDRYVSFDLMDGDLRLAIDRKALKHLNKLRLAYWDATDEVLPKILLDAGRMFYELDGADRPSPRPRSRWYPVEGQWLWVRDGGRRDPHADAGFPIDIED